MNEVQKDMKCPKCGAENPENNKFCSQCGSPLEQKHLCSCGAELPEGALFCPECGLALKGVTAEDIEKEICRLVDEVYNRKNSIENGHEWVDLGLPSGLKWASCNVGASRPEEYGDYFAWGEVEPKGNYSNENYRYHDDPETLPLKADAAHANWGGNWRMPTDDEWTELREECEWKWCTQDGVSGYRVTGPNGNSIFFPAAGYRYDTSLYDAGSDGNYWSSSLLTDYSGYAYCVDFYSSNVDRYGDSRYGGRSVRPVCPLR